MLVGMKQQMYFVIRQRSIQGEPQCQSIQTPNVRRRVRMPNSRKQLVSSYNRTLHGWDHTTTDKIWWRWLTGKYVSSSLRKRNGLYFQRLHCASEKSRQLLFIFKNFDKRGSIFIICSLLNIQKGYAEGAGIKTPTSPQIWCHTTLRKVNGQLYSFTVQLIQFKVRHRCLITVNVHKGCYFFIYLYKLIYNMCLKCLPSAYMHVSESLFKECINCCLLFKAGPNVYLHNWKEMNNAANKKLQ